MNARSVLDALFVEVRQSACALEIALLVRDAEAGHMAASRLRLSLSRRTSLPRGATIAERALRAEFLGLFEESTRGMHELLARVPRTVQAERSPAPPSPRLTRWMMAARRSEGADRVPDLFELDATGHELNDAQFIGLHLARCSFITSLRRARFADAYFDKCDFTYGNLQDTLWQA